MIKVAYKLPTIAYTTIQGLVQKDKVGIMEIRWIIGAVIGAVVGGLVGYLGKCSGST
jgi:uncharacterized protein YcfJ